MKSIWKFVLICCVFLPLQSKGALGDPTYKQRVIKGDALLHGKLADITIDPALYETPSSKNFLVGIRVSNHTNRTVGIDLRDYFQIVYPNQWQISLEDHRTGAIDEERIILKKMDQVIKDKLISDFSAHKLTELLPETEVTYYREFDGASGQSARQDIENHAAKISNDQQHPKKFLIISFDGELLATDGLKTESINFTNNKSSGGGFQGSEAAFPFPLYWKKLTGSEKIIYHH